MNPFDSVNNQKAINPFDSVSQTTSNSPNITNNLPINPFEQAASNKSGGIINPFDTAINPFDNVPPGQNISFGNDSIQKKLEAWLSIGLILMMSYSPKRCLKLYKNPGS